MNTTPITDHLPDGSRVHMEEFNQALGNAPRHKYGKGLQQDWPTMLRVLDRLSPEPVADTREFLARTIAAILMGNTDAHLKNWALVYPNGQQPRLAPVYDCVCVTAFFPGSPPQQYAVNKKIDTDMRALSWDDVQALIQAAGLLRASRHVALLKDVVRRAKADWPALLGDAPAAMREAVLARLQGGVLLSV